MSFDATPNPADKVCLRLGSCSSSRHHGALRSAIEVTVREGIGPQDSGSTDLEWLVAEERDNDCGHTVLETDGRRSCTSMMANS